MTFSLIVPLPIRPASILESLIIEIILTRAASRSGLLFCQSCCAAKLLAKLQQMVSFQCRERPALRKDRNALQNFPLDDAAIRIDTEQDDRTCRQSPLDLPIATRPNLRSSLTCERKRRNCQSPNSVCNTQAAIAITNNTQSKIHPSLSLHNSLPYSQDRDFA